MPSCGMRWGRTSRAVRIQSQAVPNAISIPSKEPLFEGRGCIVVDFCLHGWAATSSPGPPQISQRAGSLSSVSLRTRSNPITDTPQPNNSKNDGQPDFWPIEMTPPPFGKAPFVIKNCLLIMIPLNCTYCTFSIAKPCMHGIHSDYKKDGGCSVFFKITYACTGW